MFRAGFLLIIRRYVQQLVCVTLKIIELCNGYVSCVYVGWLLAASQRKHIPHTNRCLQYTQYYSALET